MVTCSILRVKNQFPMEIMIFTNLRQDVTFPCDKVMAFSHDVVILTKPNNQDNYANYVQPDLELIWDPLKFVNKNNK